MPRKTKNSMKEKCMEFYENFKWDKISFASFYQLCRKDEDANWEYTIQPKFKTRKKKYRWNWAAEMERYDNQPEPKATRPLFRDRLLLWISKEQSILTGEAREKVKAERATQRRFAPPTKTYVRKYSTPRGEEEINPDHYRIDITYPKEVARVFRETYEELIEKTEEKIRYETEKAEQKKLYTELELLEAQLNIFNSYNK